jgi:hypothetical protein
LNQSKILKNKGTEMEKKRKISELKSIVLCEFEIGHVISPCFTLSSFFLNFLSLTNYKK